MSEVLLYIAAVLAVINASLCSGLLAAVAIWRFGASPEPLRVQGCLAHKKTPPTRTLPYASGGTSLLIR